MARMIPVQVLDDDGDFVVVSPKGGARGIGRTVLYGAGPGTIERHIFNALDFAVRSGRDCDLTIDQMRWLAERGRDLTPAAQQPRRSRQMERIAAGTMTPMLDGTYSEIEVEKYAFQCLGCGLVWSREWHADTCGDRGHVSSWQQRYVSGPIVNGKPSAERFYPRVALRRERVA